MIKLCKFKTFAECKEAQHYDHLYQKAISLAIVTGIDIAIIRNNNLHVQDDEGVFPLDAYLLENNLKLSFPQEYENSKKNWLMTTAWSSKYKFGNDFVYIKDHSDRIYDIIEVESLVDCIFLDDNGNEIKEEV